MIIDWPQNPHQLNNLQTFDNGVTFLLKKSTMASNSLDCSSVRASLVMKLYRVFWEESHLSSFEASCAISFANKLLNIWLVLSYMGHEYQLDNTTMICTVCRTEKAFFLPSAVQCTAQKWYILGAVVYVKACKPIDIIH